MSEFEIGQRVIRVAGNTGVLHQGGEYIISYVNADYPVVEVEGHLASYDNADFRVSENT
jgi:hypothetical protein